MQEHGPLLHGPATRSTTFYLVCGKCKCHMDRMAYNLDVRWAERTPPSKEQCNLIMTANATGSTDLGFCCGL